MLYSGLTKQELIHRLNDCLFMFHKQGKFWLKNEITYLRKLING